MVHMEINKVKNLFKISALLLFVAFSWVFIVPVPTVGASAESDVCDSIGGKWIGGKCITTGPTLDNTISNIVNTLSIIIGIVSVIMVIIGGFKFVTSGGDPAATKSARNTILFALVGIVVVALAQAIVWFTLDSAF